MRKISAKFTSALLCGLLAAGAASAQQTIRFGSDATYPHLNQPRSMAKS